MESEKQELHN